jgi:hypothetical protein
MTYKLEGLSKEIWQKKYKYENEKNITDTWRRVAKAISSVEKDSEHWENKFYDMLYDFKCTTCSEVIETNENIPPICSTCSGTMQRIWSAPGIKFNAPGFYSTGG